MDKFPNMDSLYRKHQAFEPFISESQILARINQLAELLKADYSAHQPVFVAVLNGSFMFASDLFKELDFDCEIQFVKVSSYQGTQSSGSIKEVIGLNQDLTDRHVVILEDIIDTGLTMDFLLKDFNRFKPKSLAICSLLVKPDAMQVPLKINYIGFEVANEFLVGYGLDFNGLARNYRNIYKLDMKSDR